mmetsp:Transcript_40695/g.73345  ORF Transcript_40695/g.73345 Transcript_40695/m.73345 type:complete len:86 (+) Transcript_40695:656-913(+)
MPPTIESVGDRPPVKTMVAAELAALAEMATSPSLAMSSVVACPTTAWKIKVPICGSAMSMNDLTCSRLVKVASLQLGQVSIWALR